MPILPITVHKQPFQGQISVDPTAMQASQSEMSFVNDGYTVLLVTNMDDNMGSDTTVSIFGVPSNSGRDYTISQLVEKEGGSYLFGPFRPAFWNDSGVVFVSFSSTTEVYVKAIDLTF
jgi:hypothetical protein